MEDALKRLDKLTGEEARVAFEQNMKATHNVDKGVGGVANTAASVDDRVAGVDRRAPCVVDKAADVDGTMNKVNDNATGVIHGV